MIASLWATVGLVSCVGPWASSSKAVRCRPSTSAERTATGVFCWRSRLRRVTGWWRSSAHRGREPESWPVGGSGSAPLRPRSLSTSSEQEHRVDTPPSTDHLEVQVGTRRPTGRADGSDEVPRGELVPDVYGHRARVSVADLERPAAHHDITAPAAGVADGFDDAAQRSPDRGSLRGSQVDAAVHRWTSSERMNASAIPAGDDAVDGARRHQNGEEDSSEHGRAYRVSRALFAGLRHLQGRSTLHPHPRNTPSYGARPGKRVVFPNMNRFSRGLPPFPVRSWGEAGSRFPGPHGRSKNPTMYWVAGPVAAPGGAPLFLRCLHTIKRR